MQVVLWDLDGTLADTEAVHFAAWQATMTALQVDYSYTKFTESFGRSNREILPTLLGQHATPDQIEAASQQKEYLYRELLRQQGLQLLPGVLDWLVRFQAAGLRQVISSSGPMANIVASVEVLDIGDFFASLMSGARLPEGKPHPEIFLNSAAAVGVPPTTCLVIEDSLAGIVAARRADMVSVAVGKVIQTPDFQRMLTTQAGPTCLPIESLEQLSWEQISGLSS
ncbi:beta-phosphoglucomutase [soil metagenome]